MEIEIRHVEDRGEFVAMVDGRKSFLRYTRDGDRTLNLVSTFVHPELRGRFIGEKLVKRALEYARENSFDVIPTCWFVDTVVDRNPQYRDLLVAR